VASSMVVPRSVDPELQALLETWARMPSAIREALTILMQSATGLPPEPEA
jgi:hypothetical protein